MSGFVDPFAQAQQQPTIEREIGYPKFGWAIQREPGGLVRMIFITGQTAHVFSCNGIDFARFKRDCEQAAPSPELN